MTYCLKHIATEVKHTKKLLKEMKISKHGHNLGGNIHNHKLVTETKQC